MKEQQIEQLAAERLLESGVRVNLPAPLFLKWWKKEVAVTIRQPYMGTLLHLSKLSLDAKFDFSQLDSGDIDNAHELVRDHAKLISRMIAVVVINSKVGIRLFSGLLSSWLLWKLKPHKLAQIAVLVVAMSGTGDFTTSIRLIRSLKMTEPKNLSPEDQGS